MKDKLLPVTDAQGKPMRGKWAQGIEPRHFTWILKSRVAICERPGGHGPSHRKVRRQEEIIWMRQNGFDNVISLIPSNHNLHNYEELQMPYLHRPLEHRANMSVRLPQLYKELQTLIDLGQKVLIHSDAIDDHILGYVAGFVLFSELVADQRAAVMLVERMFSRQLGPDARAMVAAIASLSND